MGPDARLWTSAGAKTGDRMVIAAYDMCMNLALGEGGALKGCKLGLI